MLRLHKIWRNFSTRSLPKQDKLVPTTYPPLSACAGCGAPFQTQFTDQQGFINPGKLLQSEAIRASRAQKAALPIEATDVSSRPDKQQPNDEWDAAYNGSLLRHYAAVDKNVRTPAQMVAEAVSYQDIKKKRKESNLVDSLRCDRCHQLSHHGYTQGTLETVHAKDFRPLLAKHLHIRSPRGAVLLKMVDLFDFEGTVVPDFHDIVGDTHEVILVANKADILPLPRIRVNRTAGHNRLVAWIRARLKALNYKLRLHSVSIVSSHSGAGIDTLMKKVMKLIDNHPGQTRDVYVVGATNVGKSSFINHLIQKKFISAGRLTTAAAPGTTLGIVQFNCSDLRAGLPKVRLFDTPGVVNSANLARLLTYDELRAVLPRKRLHAFTVRVSPGHTIFLGAMGRLDYVSGYTGCFFTMYTSDDVNVHVTKTDGASELYEKYAGIGNEAQGYFLGPPYSSDRLPLVGLGRRLEDTPGIEISVKGKGWRDAACDVVFPGVGWISVTGSETIKLKAFCNPKLRVQVREPLFPIPNIKSTTTGYTGTDPRRLNRIMSLHKALRRRERRQSKEEIAERDRENLSTPPAGSQENLTQT